MKFRAVRCEPGQILKRSDTARCTQWPSGSVGPMDMSVSCKAAQKVTMP